MCNSILLHNQARNDYKIFFLPFPFPSSCHMRGRVVRRVDLTPNMAICSTTPCTILRTAQTLAPTKGATRHAEEISRKEEKASRVRGNWHAPLTKGRKVGTKDIDIIDTWNEQTIQNKWLSSRAWSSRLSIRHNRSVDKEVSLARGSKHRTRKTSAPATPKSDTVLAERISTSRESFALLT